MESFFLTADEARQIAEEVGTPAYVYDEAHLRGRAEAARGLPHAFGLTVRYAMKALPNRVILQRFDGWGLHFDASSGYEVERLRQAGVAIEKVSLSTQELPGDIGSWLNDGMEVNACSLQQVERIGRARPGTAIGLRVNPGVGSGSTAKTNTGGPSSSFGIWHELIEQAGQMAAQYDLTVKRIHSHIGSGTEPAVWDRAADLTLAIVRRFPDVTTLNLGGGFKVEGAEGINLAAIGERVAELLRQFATATGRSLHLEIEPGKYLVQQAGVLLATVQDVTETGAEGHRFLKLDAGMTEILRPSLYASQHPMRVVAEAAEEPVVVVGHCCESGDLLTCAPGDPETLAPRKLPRAETGTLFQVGNAGSYCSSMSALGYNSFPQAPEVLRLENGGFRLIRRRQPVAQIWSNEVDEPVR